MPNLSNCRRVMATMFLILLVGSLSPAQDSSTFSNSVQPHEFSDSEFFLRSGDLQRYLLSGHLKEAEELMISETYAVARDPTRGSFHKLASLGDGTCWYYFTPTDIRRITKRLRSEFSKVPKQEFEIPDNSLFYIAQIYLEAGYTAEAKKLDQEARSAYTAFFQRFQGFGVPTEFALNVTDLSFSTDMWIAAIELDNDKFRAVYDTKKTSLEKAKRELTRQAPVSSLTLNRTGDLGIADHILSQWAPALALAGHRDAVSAFDTAMRGLQQVESNLRFSQNRDTPLQSTGDYQIRANSRLLSQALSYSLHKSSEQSILDQSSEWLINRKAPQHDLQLQNNYLSAIVPKQKERMLTLSSLIGAYGKAVYSGGLETKYHDYYERFRTSSDGQLEFTKEQIDQLDTHLNEFFGRRGISAPWANLESVQKALSNDEWLVDFVRVREFDFHAKAESPLWKGYKYLAYIIPPNGKGNVRLIDLGDANEIDQLVEQARVSLLKPFTPNAQNGETPEFSPLEDEQVYRAAALSLSKRVWEPLASHMASAKEVVLSPDGALWLFPFEALPTGDGQYLVESLPIRYQVASRYLITGSRSLPSTAPVVFSNPDFGLAGPSTVSPSSNSSDRRSARTLFDRAKELPGTAREAQAILPGLTRFAEARPIQVSGKAATETFLKQLESPQTLVLATHAFNLNWDQVWNRRGFEDVFMKCGVLLAGCNAPSEMDDDGVLSGREAASLRLTGTDLVCVSACGSGLGDFREGETVAGLRQGFHLAGAKTVVATVWSIDDEESVPLMEGFFANLGSGESKADALRNAKLARIQHYRNEYGAAHPYFWAGYTLTGASERMPSNIVGQ